MKIYFYIFLIVLGFFWFGVIGPYCISAKSNLMVIGWGFITLFFAVSGTTELIQYFKKRNLK